MQARRTVIRLLPSETRTVSPSPTETTVAAFTLVAKQTANNSAEVRSRFIPLIPKRELIRPLDEVEFLQGIRWVYFPEVSKLVAKLPFHVASGEEPQN